MESFQGKLQLLTKVRTLLAEPSAWTKEAFCRGPDGKDVRLSSTTAVCWCLSGAAAHGVRASHLSNDGWIAHMDCLAELLGFGDVGDMEAWNDAPARTHAEVLERLDRAIRKLSENSTTTQEDA